jgi:hypothetical protein
LLARLMSRPVCARSWKPMWSACRCAKSRSRSQRSVRRLAEGEVATRGAQGPGHEPDHDDGQRPREQRAVTVDGLVDGGADEEGTAILVPLQSRPISPPRAMPRLWAASVARSRRQPSRRPLAVTRFLCSPSSAAVDDPTSRPSARLPAQVRDHPGRSGTRPAPS